MFLRNSVMSETNNNSANKKNTTTSKSPSPHRSPFPPGDNGDPNKHSHPPALLLREEIKRKDKEIERLSHMVQSLLSNARRSVQQETSMMVRSPPPPRRANEYILASGFFTPDSSKVAPIRTQEFHDHRGEYPKAVERQYYYTSQEDSSRPRRRCLTPTHRAVIRYEAAPGPGSYNPMYNRQSTPVVTGGRRSASFDRRK
eukprot:PhF_6_TR18575/c0_g1_i1/m.27133